MPGAKLIAAWALLLVVPNTGSTFRDRDTREATRIDRVDPAKARPGDIVMIYGRGLERSKIADVLLTDGDHSALTHIVDQSDTSIRVRLPRMLEAGSYSIVLATCDRETRFLDKYCSGLRSNLSLHLEPQK